MYDALYARQSVDRSDSISIESQLEFCRFEARGHPCKEYVDRGYSGKNTHRPAFEDMLADIRQEKIARVIVYKLDRISRSILDFANMMELFEKYGVEFVSSTERFDTSTPIGRAMLNICIVFAQLERETIQKRVADAYRSRSKRGFYMGGRVPYGFSRTETTLDGVRTSMYTPIPEEARQIRLIYSLYSHPENSLGDILRRFKEQDVRHLRGGLWSTARLSEILCNPVYVRADADVYDFFKSRGAVLIDPVSDFTGERACYLYRGPDSASRRQNDLNGREVVLAPHAGLVSSQDWLACRLRCLTNRQSVRTGKARNSWLSGKIKCGKCGHALTIVKSNTKWQRYFVCAAASASKKSACPGTGGTVYADLLERYISDRIEERLRGFPSLSPPKSPADTETNQNKIRLIQIEEEMADCFARTAGASPPLLAYINDRIEALDAERTRLQTEKVAPPPDTQSADISDRIAEPAEQWRKASFEEKRAVADILIRRVTIADNRIDIFWRI